MPAGMRLKSDGFASDLYAGSAYSLKAYCAEQGLAYDDLQIPVPLETFISYGLAFQRRFVPMLEENRVVALVRDSGAFEVTLEDGARLRANRVVVACGINEYAYVPPEVARLGTGLCTHASVHRELSVFEGKRIAVIGGGVGADVAAILHQQGANCFARLSPPIDFHAPPGIYAALPLYRIRHPHLGLGQPALGDYTLFLSLFRYLPRRLRHHVVRRRFGPAGGWFVRDEVIGKVMVHCGYRCAPHAGTKTAST
jgi:hypothetical protein